MKMSLVSVGVNVSSFKNLCVVLTIVFLASAISQIEVVAQMMQNAPLMWCVCKNSRANCFRGNGMNGVPDGKLGCIASPGEFCHVTCLRSPGNYTLHGKLLGDYLLKVVKGCQKPPMQEYCSETNCEYYCSSSGCNEHEDYPVCRDHPLNY